MTPITFGTDGWRAVIAEDFTTENVQRVAQATALHFLELKRRARCVIVGYDSRFRSEAFAACTAEVLCGNGLPVLLTPKAVPTPAVSWGVKHFRAVGAVIITSSHNPSEYNGFKLKSEFGGSALPETTRRVERLIDRRPVKTLALALARERGLLKDANLDGPYLSKLTRYVDISAIRRNPLTVVYDPLYGSGQGYLQAALEHGRRGVQRCRVIPIHDRRDPLFGGLNPEPIAENLGEVMAAVKRYRAQMGLVVDGDADRVGLVDDRGRYVTSHKVLALLLHHFVRNRRERGPVARTISGTFLIDRMCEVYGLEMREMPVGFKHLGELILYDGFMLGGEESGGMGFHRYLPERDGVLTCLLLLELAARERKPISRLLAELTAEFGPFHYDRRDAEFPLERRADLLRGLVARPPARLDGVAVREIKDLDGVKFILRDGSWLLIRPSGTEPLVRIYAESPQSGRVGRLLAAGRRLAFTYAGRRSGSGPAGATGTGKRRVTAVP